MIVPLDFLVCNLGRCGMLFERDMPSPSLPELDEVVELSSASSASPAGDGAFWALGVGLG
jgi:hypothetical protein